MCQIRQKIYYSNYSKNNHLYFQLIPTGLDDKNKPFAVYYPIPNFVDLPSSTKETLEFAAEISRGEQFFKSGLIYPVSFILDNLGCI